MSGCRWRGTHSIRLYCLQRSSLRVKLGRRLDGSASPVTSFFHAALPRIYLVQLLRDFRKTSPQLQTRFAAHARTSLVLQREEPASSELETLEACPTPRLAIMLWIFLDAIPRIYCASVPTGESLGTGVMIPSQQPLQVALSYASEKLQLVETIQPACCTYSSMKGMQVGRVRQCAQGAPEPRALSCPSPSNVRYRLLMEGPAHCLRFARRGSVRPLFGGRARRQAWHWASFFTLGNWAG